MSKAVSRSARRALALRKSVGCVVERNLASPKPGRSLERSHASPDALGAKSARFHDPAGNTFNAHYEPGSRPDYKRDERELARTAKISAAFLKALKVYHDRQRLSAGGQSN